MARKRSNKQTRANNAVLPVMRPDAAGIDIGATEIFVAVPADRATENVRSFSTFTQDLYALADCLKSCSIATVAMESTGVYWIPLFQVLEDRGFEVCLVNALHVKNVPGRRTDVSDCQWLQFLSNAGRRRHYAWPQSLHHSKSGVGDFYRRMRAKLGAPKAITAAAHKLARIIFHLVTTRQEFDDDSRFAADQLRYEKRQEAKLRAKAHALGFQLIPAQDGEVVP